MCIFLGCYSPMILRPVALGQFQIVGEAYIHGLEDATGILGSLSSDWKAIIIGDTFGRTMHRYLNLKTYEQTAEDPRLHDLPPEWERISYERSPNDPALYEVFKNKNTQESINSDPRLTAEALRVRGVKLEKFQLI